MSACKVGRSVRSRWLATALSLTVGCPGTGSERPVPLSATPVAVGQEGVIPDIAGAYGPEVTVRMIDAVMSAKVGPEILCRTSGKDEYFT